MIDYRRVFQPDSGMLLDIMVFDIDLENWRTLLKHLSGSCSLSYSEDDVKKPLQDVESIFANRLQLSARLDILVPGFTLCCHFFGPTQIEIDLLPEEIDTEQKASLVFDFMTGIAKCLGKAVFLTSEFASATDHERREMAVCVVDQKGALQQRI